jgi:phage replication O-like protein O
MEQYTQIPNYIIDKWMSNMKYYSFITLMAICRKTIGYEQHRDTCSDYISLSQLQKITGLARATVVKAIKDLEDKEIITVTREGKINKIKFNIDSSCGIPIQNEIVHNVNHGSIPDEPMGSIPDEHTKENIKDNQSKENSDLYRWLIDIFYVSYSLKYNEKLIINSKEGKQVKEIIKIATKANKENPKQEILKKLDILKESTYLKLVPGTLLSQWNSLVKDKQPSQSKQKYKEGTGFYNV